MPETAIPLRPRNLSRRRFLNLAGGATLLAGCTPIQQLSGTPRPTADLPSEPQLLRKPYQSTATQKQREHFLYLPRGYETDKDKIWPVILFLHGGGERGDGLEDLDYVLDHGPLMEAWIQRRDLPFIILSPQLPVFSMSGQIDRPATKPQRLESGVPPRDEKRPTTPMIRTEGDHSPFDELGPPDGWWMVEKDLLNMVDSTLSDYRADAKRVYLTGLSYGGFGTWYMVTYHPDRWAAIAPICGLGDPSLASILAAVNMPIWIFQGGRDEIIQPQWIYPMANSLEEAGLKTVRLTIHEDLGHNAWTRVYAGEDLYTWFLSHSLSPTPTRQLSSEISLDPTVALTPAAALNSAMLRSPEINADRTVTLRLHSATATVVTASGDIGDLTLTKDAQNVWSTTTAPLEPAIYRYFFTVDGAQIADPGNPDKKGTAESLVTVPGNPPMPWEVRNVPHGNVTQVSYQSMAFNARRRYFVYTPPGYETSAAQLPVLYLLHGYTDDDSSWTAVGKANLIADSLLADGRIKPLLIVMPYGQLNSDATVNEAFAADFQQKFEQELVTEIMPSIEKNYRVIPDARHRAMAGVSLGGMQTALIGMNHPETFSTIGLWSSAVFGDPAVLLGRLAAAPANLKNSFAYVQVAVGQQDDLNLLPRSEAIDEFLTSQKIKHEYTPTPGTHSWLLWRRYLVNFLIRFSAVAQ